MEERCPPVACTTQSGNITIGPVLNSAITSATVPVTVKCNAVTSYKLTVGTLDGAELVPYTTGGRVRMSIDGGIAQRPNTFVGDAQKDEPIQKIIRATTVPGTAAPGTYSASAVVSLEIL